MSDTGKEEPKLKLNVQGSGGTAVTVTASNSSSFPETYFPNGLEKKGFEKKE